MDLSLKALVDTTSKLSITAGKKYSSALSKDISRSVSEEVKFVGSKLKWQDDEELNENEK